MTIVLEKKYYTFDDVQLTDQYSEIRKRDNNHISLSTMLARGKPLNIPIISSPMDSVTGWKMAAEMSDLGGCGFIHRFGEQKNISHRLSEVERVIKQSLSSSPVFGVAIGATGDYFENAKQLLRAGVKILLIDVAKGNGVVVEEAMYNLNILRDEFDFSLVAGNVATSEGARNLCEWGADAIRVGIGNGSLCETRIRTGVGTPQVTAIMDCSQVANEYDVPVIADGGIRFPCDVGKALAAGASTVMLGRILAATDASPGEKIKLGMWGHEQYYKRYRGSASRSAKLDRGEKDSNVEGNEKIELCQGPLKDVIESILDGLRTTMSYIGASTIGELHEKAEFQVVTQSGIKEAYPHAFLD